MILDEIVKNKKKEIQALQRKKPLGVLKKEVSLLPRRRPLFRKALLLPRDVAVIAEIKKQSPSKGVLRRDFDPQLVAREYERHGASALSVLTDEKFFGGSSAILREVRSVTRIPILRKDFILDEYQIWESRLMGADAVLLIASILPVGELKKFVVLARRLGLDALVEIHTQEDLEKALAAKPDLVGINNRDLRDFHVDKGTTGHFARLIPKHITLVSESGIGCRRDLLWLKKLGVRAALVGESLATKLRAGEALDNLLRG